MVQHRMNLALSTIILTPLHQSFRDFIIPSFIRHIQKRQKQLGVRIVPDVSHLTFVTMYHTSCHDVLNITFVKDATHLVLKPHFCQGCTIPLVLYHTSCSNLTFVKDVPYLMLKLTYCIRCIKNVGRSC